MIATFLLLFLGTLIGLGVFWVIALILAEIQDSDR
jgi:hypothetical protein